MRRAARTRESLCTPLRDRVRRADDPCLGLARGQSVLPPRLHQDPSPRTTAAWPRRTTAARAPLTDGVNSIQVSDAAVTVQLLLSGYG